MMALVSRFDERYVAKKTARFIAYVLASSFWKADLKLLKGSGKL